MVEDLHVQQLIHDRLQSLERASIYVLQVAAMHKFWSIGFSGGKDSSVLLDLVLRFLLDNCREGENNSTCPEKVIVVYSDTLLEPPPLRLYARGVIEAIKRVAQDNDLPLQAFVADPRETNEDLVEMVIGRGYPAPSTRFRWCSDRWKLRPTRKVLEKALGRWSRRELAVITGVRGEEAVHRRSRGPACACPLRMTDDLGGTPYAPLLSWRASDIWSYLDSRNPTWGTPSWSKLRTIYGGKGTLRMGCWPCTLISRDYGWKDLAERGLISMEAYQALTTWKKLWLHLSRGRPDLWRLPKKTNVTKKGRIWKYQYSKLRPEARLLLALFLKEMAMYSQIKLILKPLLQRLDTYLNQLIEYKNEMCKLLNEDNHITNILENSNIYIINTRNICDKL